MPNLKYENKKRFYLFKSLPNTVTFLALILGMSSIRYAIDANWHSCVICIIIAAFCDVLDGRLARALNTTSKFGAELDSLCDFANFGIAPSIIMYYYTSHTGAQNEYIRWSICMLYVCCLASRLARFNIMNVAEAPKKKDKHFFVGVPAPMAGILAIMPVIIELEIKKTFDIFFYDWQILLNMFVVAILASSRIRTFAVKHIVIPNHYVWLLFILLIIFVLSFLLWPWVALPVLCILYLASIPISVLIYYFYL